MYTTPQMHQEITPGTARPFPSLWELTLRTLRIWRDGWGIFSVINIVVIVLGICAMLIIVSIMPWIKTLLIDRQAVDPAVIVAYYPSIASFINDLVIVVVVLLVLALVIALSQIMTIHAMNPEMRAKGFNHILARSVSLVPKYSWTLAIVCLMTVGGLALLIVPGLLVLPIAIAAVFVVALEGSSGLKAITQSALYVKGYIIESLWRSIVILLVIHGVSLLLPRLAALLVYPFTLFHFSDYTIRILSFTAGTLYTSIALILSLIMPSLLMIYYFHIYSHMKDNPTSDKPLYTKTLVSLAVIGLIVCIGVLVLESWGI
jgi:hypothetical protein